MKRILTIIFLLLGISFTGFCRDVATDISIFANGDLHSVKRVIEDGADINAVFNDLPAFIYAVAGQRRMEVIEYLIGVGANVNVRDSHGASALFHACAVNQGTPQIIEVLIRHGAIVNDEEDGSSSALAMARLIGNKEAERILLGHGAH